jgi:hypothetical protein
MKLENYGPTGECLNNNQKTSQKWIFLFLTITFKIQKVQNGKPLMREQSAASFCCQGVAARFPGMFCNFYLVKSQKIAKNSATSKAREKLSTYLESFEF